MRPCLFTTTDARRIYHIPERTLRRWIQAGHITNHGTPHAIRVDAFELAQHLDHQQAA